MWDVTTDSRTPVTVPVSIGSSLRSCPLSSPVYSSPGPCHRDPSGSRPFPRTSLTSGVRPVCGTPLGCVGRGEVRAKRGSGYVRRVGTGDGVWLRWVSGCHEWGRSKSGDDGRGPGGVSWGFGVRVGIVLLDFRDRGRRVRGPTGVRGEGPDVSTGLGVLSGDGCCDLTTTRRERKK